MTIAVPGATLAPVATGATSLTDAAVREFFPLASDDTEITFKSLEEYAALVARILIQRQILAGTLLWDGRQYRDPQSPLDLRH